jgi:hypothetical protein
MKSLCMGGRLRRLLPIVLLACGSGALAQTPDPAQRLPRTAPRAVQSRLPLQINPAPGPGAVLVERENCGTAWTDWVTDPEADVNPCPATCMRGERQVLDSRKSGDTEQYQARYQCYLPELAIDQPAGIVGALLADGTPRTNCGTVWTAPLGSPDTSVNPCPANCDRGELQVVRRSGVGSEALRYELRYQCYIAESGGTATSQSGLAAAASPRAATARTGIIPAAGVRGAAVVDSAPSGATAINEIRSNVIPGSGPWHTFVQVLGAEPGTATAARVVWYPNDDDTQPMAGMLSATLRGVTPDVGAEIEIPENAGGSAGGVIRIMLTVPGSTTPKMMGRFTVLTAGNGVSQSPGATSDLAVAGPGLAGQSTIDTSSMQRPGPKLSGVVPGGIGSVTVSWDAVPDATRYEVNVFESGRQQGVQRPVAIQPGVASYSVTVDGLAPGLEHMVWVTAYYAQTGRLARTGGEALGASEQIAIQLDPAENPAAMTAEVVGTDTVRLSWTGVAGAESYRLVGPHLTQTDTAATTIELRQVPMGEYQWEVRAIFKNGIFMPERPATANLMVGTREAWVARAYDEGLRRHGGVGPDPVRWKSLAAALDRNYDELVAAFDAIWVVNHAYWYLLQREATAAEAEGYVSGLQGGALVWTDVWRSLAQSDARRQLRGSWAPAPIPQLTEARLLFAQPGLVHPETCFGAIGPQCEGGPVTEAVWHDEFVLPDGTRMAFVDANISVGAILHDNLCLSTDLGLHCGEAHAWDWYVDLNFIDPLAIVAKALVPGAREWNKAVWNTIDRRRWRQTFGPYPVVEEVRRASWYDDLTGVTPRQAWMAPVVAIFTIPVHTERYEGGETRWTRTLQAPAGTAIDYRDAAFCRTGSFSGTRQEFGKADAGICR